MSINMLTHEQRIAAMLKTVARELDDGNLKLLPTKDQYVCTFEPEGERKLIEFTCELHFKS